MRWTVIAVAILVAGCSQDATPEQDEQDDYDEFALDETRVDRGVIRGVIVDPAIRPVGGAQVTVDGIGEVVTKEAGVFAFKDLAPGIYFVKVSRVGYEDTQTSAEVKAGVTDPEPLRVVLERAPGTEPNIEPDTFRGYITCSIRNPALGYNDGCFVFGNLGLGSTQERILGFTPGNLLWIQTELIWTPNSLTSERLCSTVWGAETTPSGEGNVNDAVCGTSPIIRTMNQSQLQAANLNDGSTVRYTTYPDHLLADVSGNIVVQQEFELFTHAFYNFLPQDGWTFGNDGEPTIPP